MIRIVDTNCSFEREPLLAPFGFKGGYVNEAWQSVARVRSESGHIGLGLCTQSILWSDASVFSGHSECGGNSLMYLMTEEALRYSRGIPFTTPMEMLDVLLPHTYEYGKKVTGNPDLRLTFALNALVAVDNAVWQLYAEENGISTFENLIPSEAQSALSVEHEKLAAIPLITYGVSLQEIESMVEQGYFFMKIKIGCDPDKDGDLDKMLDWDKDRLSSIHRVLKEKSTPYVENGRIPYYLDANGRYDSKDRLMRLLDHAERIGALENIILLEEPFPEEYKIDVGDIPVRLAADESAHSDKDVLERIELGYGAIALKPIAKTMSMSLKIAKIARDKDIPCFCADLTVNPILVDWNKNVAARLAPLPGMKIGVLESNGHQNYFGWQKMLTYHPCFGASWMEMRDGLFELGDEFYAKSGGIFQRSEHYQGLLRG